MRHSASSETITVIIPLYNRREEVSRALASVFRQSRAADEIVVVDDASRDGSAEAVSKCAAFRARSNRRAL
jgi:glycosyltransferase involved in cell wall biosynthesis